jgi:hypothetical protein
LRAPPSGRPGLTSGQPRSEARRPAAQALLVHEPAFASDFRAHFNHPVERARIRIDVRGLRALHTPASYEHFSQSREPPEIRLLSTEIEE